MKCYQANWDEGTAVSIEGFVDNWILDTLPWTFAVTDVTAPVFVWFGELDALVPTFHADRIADNAPHATMFGCPQCQHYAPVGHWPEILANAVDHKLH